MEITLEKNSVETLERVIDAHICGENTSEAVVPDSLPDILRIADADAEIYIREKEIQGETVVLSGVAEASALCVSEAEAGIFVIESDIPFSLSAKCPGASGGERITAQVRLAYLEASLANPRKILLKAEVAADIAVYRAGELEFSTVSAELPASCEILGETIEILRTVSAREKTFSMSFENDLPVSLLAAEELLKTRTSLIVDESKGVGTKAIVKGRVKTEAVFAANTGELLCESFETPFSQIIETDCPAEDAEYGSSAFLTGTYYELAEDSSGKLLSGEIHMAVQTVSYRRENIGCIKDMYSTRFPLECKMKKQIAETRRVCKTQTAELRGALRFPAAPTRLGDAHACCGRPDISEQGGSASLHMPVTVSACGFSDAGELIGASGRLELNASLETEGMIVRSLCAAPEEVRCVIADGGMDVSVLVTLSYELFGSEEIECVLEASCGENEKYDASQTPSILIIRVPEGKSIWSIAKENRSSTALIYSANPELSPEGDNAGRLILIPRAT